MNSLALSTATGDPTPNFYNNTPYSPLSEGLGLRQVYRWGFYGMEPFSGHFGTLADTRA
jgi:hypothetical protein